MFKKGDQIVYGSMGVCLVTDICVPDMAGMTRECYLLQPEYFPETRVWAPVENNPVTMRTVMTACETHELIDSMPELPVLEMTDKNECAKHYRSVLQSADGRQVAQLVKTLYEKRRRLKEGNKNFSSADKDTLSSAETLLHGEVAEVLNLRIEDVPAYINGRIGAIA